MSVFTTCILYTATFLLPVLMWAKRSLFQTLPSPDRFLWRYFLLYSLWDIFHIVWPRLYGYSQFAHDFCFWQEPLVVGMFWFWDRLPGAKWLQFILLNVAVLALGEWLPRDPLLLVSSVLTGALGSYIGAKAVWRGHLGWRNLMQFGVGLIMAHSCFAAFIDRMPFAWEPWLATSYRAFLLYLALFRLAFCHHYFWVKLRAVS